MGTVYQLTDAATITPDFTAASVDAGQRRAVFAVTLGGNRSLASPVGALDGQHMVLRVTQDSTGSRTLSWGSAFNFSSPGHLPAPDWTGLAGMPGVCTEMIFGYAQGAAEWRLLSGPYQIPAGAALTWPSWS